MTKVNDGKNTYKLRRLITWLLADDSIKFTRALNKFLYKNSILQNVYIMLCVAVCLQQEMLTSQLLSFVFRCLFVEGI